MELSSYQEIYYKTSHRIEIKEVVESLLAMERTLKLAPLVLEKMFPGTKIDSVDVYIEAVESGSLTEKFLYKFCFKSEENFDLFLEKARQRLGLDGEKMGKAAFVIGLIIVGIILGGGVVAFTKTFGNSEPSQHIEANNNRIINIGAKELDLDPNQLRELIKSVLENQDQIAADAVKIVKPAKGDPDSEIVINGNQQLKIENAAIKEFPDKTESAQEIETDIVTSYRNMEVFIRATDLDSKSKGWAAIIPGLSSERTRMQINGNIDLEELRKRGKIHGDVVLVEKMKGNEKKSSYYILEKISDKDKFDVQMNLLSGN